MNDDTGTTDSNYVIFLVPVSKELAAEIRSEAHRRNLSIAQVIEERISR